MLKIHKLYIHFLTVAMFIVFFMNGHITELSVSYASMLLHELAHTAAAAAIGLKISHIALYPFGVNLKLKNKMVAHLSEELILYLSGPAVNILLALLALRPGYEFMYRTNILLFAMNMLPMLPLDGGCILKRALSGAMGSIGAMRVMRVVSAVLAAAFMLAGVCVVRVTGYNYSVILLAVFMTGNIFTQREKYNTEYIRELMFYRDKPLKRARLIAAYDDSDYRDIARSFTPGHFGIVCTIDRSGRVKRLMSEREVIDGIIEKS